MTVIDNPPVQERLPDFVIGGAPRCGTTWLYRALDRHPAIWLAKPVRPEPKFFLVDDEYRQGLDHYKHKWFSSVPDGMMAGEKSTNYLESSSAAERLAEALPDAKLVFLLREPAARAFSHYRFSRMNDLEKLSFPMALEQEAQREQGYEGPLAYSRPFSYFTRGLYAEHLERWFKLFPRENILIKRYEDICSEPSALLNDIHRFLGVEPRPEDGDGLGVINAAESDEVGPSVLESLRRRYAEPNHQLYRLLGSTFWNEE